MNFVIANICFARSRAPWRGCSSSLGFVLELVRSSCRSFQAGFAPGCALLALARPRTLVFAVLASWIAELCFSIPNATNVTHRWIVFLLSLPFGAYKICSRDYEFAAERAKLRIRNFSCILYAPQGRILSNRNSRIHFSLNFPRDSPPRSCDWRTS